jgi:hypothetical protein
MEGLKAVAKIKVSLRKSSIDHFGTLETAVRNSALFAKPASLLKKVTGKVDSYNF